MSHPVIPLQATAAGASGRHPAPTRIGARTFVWGERTFVMGILNVTPDSFSQDGLLAGSRARSAEAASVVDAGTGDGRDAEDGLHRAVDLARAMAEAGADLLDIGGESTRPGHERVDAAAERARVIPVIAAVRAALPDMPISVDTTKADVAEAALAAGADLLNDVSATLPGSGLEPVAAAHGVPLVLMHNRAEARYTTLLPEIIADLQAAIERARRAGVREEDLIVDPGFGFGKTAAHNIDVLRHLPALRLLGRPILLGTSRKSTLGRILDLPVDQRLEATLATTALG
ncbi:MAG: dihydropteroate synthase, partial [Chloroflexi bacterium]|nr:dihydropteroate synthase [Chloroflexota bacterium]